MSAFGYYEKDEVVLSIEVLAVEESRRGHSTQQIVESVMEAVTCGLSLAFYSIGDGKAGRKMNDKKLLELAAKAAGIDGKYQDADDFNHDEYGAYDGIGIYCQRGKAWNPLTDDGDALRLAVKMAIIYNNYPDATVADPLNANAYKQEHGTDPYAATRRAIVLAAAEIGKGMG